jgi:hypothetical protein
MGSHCSGGELTSVFSGIDFQAKRKSEAGGVRFSVRRVLADNDHRDLSVSVNCRGNATSRKPQLTNVKMSDALFAASLCWFNAILASFYDGNRRPANVTVGLRCLWLR